MTASALTFIISVSSEMMRISKQNRGIVNSRRMRFYDRRAGNFANARSNTRSTSARSSA
jgi:hypothetical protein